MLDLRNARPPGMRAQHVFFYLLLAFIVALPGACGGSSSTPVVGPIEFVTSSGSAASAVSSLPVNGVIYLLATVTNDDEMLGVSWTASCGSQPSGTGSNNIISTACGIFTPTQTLSGPVPTYPASGYVTEYSAPSAIPKGNTVTITAHATSLPSSESSLNLTIVQ